MKTNKLLFLTFTMFAFASCNRNQTTTDRVGDKIDDALNQRPAERIRDSIEDSKDAIKRESKDIKNLIK